MDPVRERAIYQRELQAYDQASAMIPTRWYEPVYALYIILIPLLTILLWVTLNRYMFSPPLWLSLLGVMAESVGWWIDTMTTHASMSLKPEFDRRGIWYPTHETNPLTRQTPHFVLQLLSPSTLLSLGSLVVVWFLPAIGISLGVVHALAGIANQRHAKRMRLELRLYDMLEAEERREAPIMNGRETHSDVTLAGPFRLVGPNRA